MEFLSGPWLLSVLQIVWIDILLSGDNAVVIALACRSLPAHQKRLGIFLGATVAVALRIVFALVISILLGVPYLRIAGGVLLFWIATKLVVGEDEDGHDIAASDSLWRAVRTIALADAVMSLDNVVAIAAASRGHPELFIFGLLLSIPLIMVGATLITALIARFPIFVWAGAALLGYIAAEMIVTDPAVLSWLGHWPSLVVAGAGGPHPSDLLHWAATVSGALLVTVVGFALARNGGRGAAKTM